MANNYQIGVNFSGNLGNLPQASNQAAKALGNVDASARSAARGMDDLRGSTASIPGIAAKAAAALGSLDAASKSAGAGFNSLGREAREAVFSMEGLASNTVKAITPIATLEARLEQLQTEMGKIGTVQGAAHLANQFDILNRTLTETKAQITQAANAAIGLSRAFNTVATGGLNRLAPAIRPVLTDLKVMPQAANQASAALNRLKGATGQGSTALTDFSRIIQDSPFGIIGIGNNITQLADSFGNLVKASGGVGPAFKSLFSAATGFGGIALAISAITSALTFASVGLSAWTRGFGGAKGATDAWKEAMEDANKTAGEEIAKITILNSVTADTSRTMKEREAAVKMLQKEYPAYFGNLSKEALLNGDVAKATYDAVTAIRSKAKAQAILTLITQETQKQLELELKREDIQRQFENRVTEFTKRSAALNKNLGITPRAAKITDNAFSDLRKSLEEANEEFKQSEQRVGDLVRRFDTADLKNPLDSFSEKTKKERKKEDETLKALRKELAGYERQLSDINELRKQGALPINKENDALDLQLKIYETLGKIDAREVAIKAKPELEINPQILELQIQEAIREAGVRMSGGEGVTVPLSIRPKFSDGSSPNPFSPANILGPIPDNAFDGVVNAAIAASQAAQARMRQALREGFYETTAQSIQEGITQAADVLGQSLSTIFQDGVGEGLAQAAEGFLGIIGNILQEVGKYVVATSKLVIALQATLKKLFGEPIAGLAAGLGLIALGGVLKNIKIPAFATGVKNFGGGVALVGETGPELVNMPQGSNVIPNHLLGVGGGQGQQLYAVIRGEDLYLSNRAVSSRRARM